jgi:hypothetical protein
MYLFFKPRAKVSAGYPEKADLKRSHRGLSPFNYRTAAGVHCRLPYFF